MTDERDPPEIPLEPFQVYRPESPFPPLDDGLPSGARDPCSDGNQPAEAHDLPTRENRLVALGRFAFPPAPPLDDDGLAARDRRWAGRTILVSAAFLLVFNAVSPLNWSRQQAPSWLQGTVQQISGVWVGQLAVFGVDMPRQGVREAWMAAREMRFTGQEPAPPAP
ncbi:hypothetical protein [Brevundimonas sp.]|uniref:hypothetical protein n=1 Tax=Brevundimonas sp. TaxID=1871086 RepID=UPI00260C3162|nr:hypothetical protein [Brevundimonas sp.]